MNPTACWIKPGLLLWQKPEDGLRIGFTGSTVHYLRHIRHLHGFLSCPNNGCAQHRSRLHRHWWLWLSYGCHSLPQNYWLMSTIYEVWCWCVFEGCPFCWYPALSQFLPSCQLEGCKMPSICLRSPPWTQRLEICLIEGSTYSPSRIKAALQWDLPWSNLWLKFHKGKTWKCREREIKKGMSWQTNVRRKAWAIILWTG